MSNTNEPAFPFKGGQNNGMQPNYGLTKREYFAGLAMQALLTATNHEGEWVGVDAAAKQAVIEADALLKELDKKRD